MYNHLDLYKMYHYLSLDVFIGLRTIYRLQMML
jgi:hypothetical protein